MSFFFNKNIQITPITKVEEKGFVKSGMIFTVKNGLGKLQKKWVDSDDDWASQGMLMLGETPITQFDGSVSSTSPAMLAEGYGIENADCEELKAIDTAINSGYIDIENSFEIIKPILGLLKDGCYLLADAEITPTDGNGKFFWDIDPKFRFYNCTAADYYLGCVQDCDIYGVEMLDPIFLYPSQSAALFDPERADFYTELFRKEEEPPRAIAYNFMNGMNVLLDGHHKAAAAAKLGIALKCLVIIPAWESWFVVDGKSCKSLNFTDDIKFSDKLRDKDVEQIIAENDVPYDKQPKEPAFADIMYRKREWDHEYTKNADKYVTAEEHALEKHFDLLHRYDEAADYLCENVKDKDDFRKYIKEDKFFKSDKRDNRDKSTYVAMRLMFKRAENMGDKRLKTAAMAAFKLDCEYMLSADALKYLRILGDDREVEDLFVSIISDVELYERFGNIAADFWEDER